MAPNLKHNSQKNSKKKVLSQVYGARTPLQTRLEHSNRWYYMDSWSLSTWDSYGPYNLGLTYKLEPGERVEADKVYRDWSRFVDCPNTNARLIFSMYTYNHAIIFWNWFLFTSSGVYNVKWWGKVDFSNKEWIEQSQRKMFAKKNISEIRPSSCSFIKVISAI